MDIHKAILDFLRKNKKVRVADIVKVTGFSRAYVNRFFQQLRKEEEIILIGKTNKAHYVLANRKEMKRAKKEILSIRRTLKNKNLSEDVVLDEIKKDTGIFFGLPKNIFQILDYAFSEMLNNAIEHSRSEKIMIKMEKVGKLIDFKVIDRGIGIFKNIMEKRRLKNELEAIQDLLKGKQTTAPKEHTGEGIFFTSKVADKLIIKGSNKKLIIDNILNDAFIEDMKRIKGTDVECIISKDSKKELSKIFRQYTDKSFEFSKTKVVVKLYKMTDTYISRSQARRISSGLDKFKIIILDFRKVDTVGQAFADEVFRVWQKKHPNIKIIYQNCNKNIEFMIKRAIGRF